MYGESTKLKSNVKAKDGPCEMQYWKRGTEENVRRSAGKSCGLRRIHATLLRRFIFRLCLGEVVRALMAILVAEDRESLRATRVFTLVRYRHVSCCLPQTYKAKSLTSVTSVRVHVSLANTRTVEPSAAERARKWLALRFVFFCLTRSLVRWECRWVDFTRPARSPFSVHGSKRYARCSKREVRTEDSEERV